MEFWGKIENLFMLEVKRPAELSEVTRRYRCDPNRDSN